MNRADAHYLLTYLDERLLLAHSIFDFDTKKTGPDADQHMTDSLHRHFFTMVCMQRKNYQPLAVRYLLDTEWRRRFVPELHELIQRNRAKLTEEMVERGANAVIRLATEGHHSLNLVVRNGRIWFSLKNDPNSILNGAPHLSYARFSSRLLPAHLIKVIDYFVSLIQKIAETSPPTPIPPAVKKGKGGAKGGKKPKNEPRVSYIFKIFQNENERTNKHCTITSEALPLAYQDADHLPGRDCDIDGCEENWPDPAHRATVQLACGHSVHQGCIQAKRSCPCAKFIERKVWQLRRNGRAPRSPVFPNRATRHPSASCPSRRRLAASRRQLMAFRAQLAACDARSEVAGRAPAGLAT